MLGNIDDKSLALLGLSSLSSLLRDESPELVSVDDGAVIPVALEVELSHTGFAVVTRMAVQQIKVSVNERACRLTICSS